MLVAAVSIAACAINCRAYVLEPPGRDPPPTRAPLSQEKREALLKLLDASPDDEIEIKMSETDERDGGSRWTDERATGTGAGLRARGDKVETGFNGSAPGASLGGDRASAKGGGSEADVSAEVFKPPSISSPLLWCGIIALIASAVFVYLKWTRAAFITGAFGAGLIAAGCFPAAFAWIVGVGGLACLGVYLWTEHEKRQVELDKKLASESADDGQRARETLRSMIAAVGGLKKTNGNLYEQIKAELAKHLTPDENEYVQGIKRQDGV